MVTMMRLVLLTVLALSTIDVALGGLETESYPLILGCCAYPVKLGLEDATIPDANITASSNWDGRDTSTPASGRLNKPDLDSTTVGAWAPAASDTKQWIQVDLGRTTCVYGVLMQGRDDGDQWVTKYMVQYEPSRRAARIDVLDQSCQVQVFDGNTNHDDVVESLFAQPIMASAVRIVPVKWQNYIALRFELIGCKSA